MNKYEEALGRFNTFINEIKNDDEKCEKDKRLTKHRADIIAQDTDKSLYTLGLSATTLQELVDRATPKKVVIKACGLINIAYCPNCKEWSIRGNFCPYCGQALEWEGK